MSRRLFLRAGVGAVSRPAFDAVRGRASEPPNGRGHMGPVGAGFRNQSPSSAR